MKKFFTNFVQNLNEFIILVGFVAVISFSFIIALNINIKPVFMPNNVLGISSTNSFNDFVPKTNSYQKNFTFTFSENKSQIDIKTVINFNSTLQIKVDLGELENTTDRSKDFRVIMNIPEFYKNDFKAYINVDGSLYKLNENGVQFTATITVLERSSTIIGLEFDTTKPIYYTIPTNAIIYK